MVTRLRLVILSLPGLVVAVWLAHVSKVVRSVDYNQFFSASHLIGTGHTYDWDVLKAKELQHTAAVPTGRIPVVLWGHKLLSWLPFPVARATWLILSLGGFVVAVWKWPGLPVRRSLIALAWSLPATATLIYGQDIPFWLLFFSLGLHFLQRKKDGFAGICFSLCICKYHLALCLPILLVAQRRWTALISGAAGVSALLAISFAIESPAWPWRYAQMARLPEFSPHLDRMPSLAGLLSLCPLIQPFEAVAIAGIAVLVGLACRHISDIGFAGALACACGVLCAHHSYVGDCALLLPLCVLTLDEPRKWLRWWAFALLTPIPALLLCSPGSRGAQMVIIGFVIMRLISLQVRSGNGSHQAQGNFNTISTSLKPERA